MQSSNINYTKDYYTIGEVADIADVDQHVVRFWSDKFKDYIKPRISAGNRRNYTPQDIETLLSIKNLLYTRGLSIKGVQLLLKEGSDIKTTSIVNTSSTLQNNTSDVILKLQSINNKIKQFLQSST